MPPTWHCGNLCKKNSSCHLANKKISFIENNPKIIVINPIKQIGIGVTKNQNIPNTTEVRLSTTHRR